MNLLLLGILSGLLAGSMGCRYGDYCPPAWGIKRTYAPPPQVSAGNSGTSNQVPVSQVTVTPQPVQQHYQTQGLASESMELEYENMQVEGQEESEGESEGGDDHAQFGQAILRPKIRRDPPTDYNSGPNKRPHY